MSSTPRPKSTHGLGSLTKMATRAVVAGGLGVAVLGPGAGTAHADPTTMSCPATPVTAGGSGTVTVAGFWGGPIFVADSPNHEVKYEGPGWGNNNGAIAVTWPSAPGLYTLAAWQVSQTAGATCTIIVAAPRAFQPVQPRDMKVYVLGSDGNLWFETGPFGSSHIPPPRLQVDGNAAAFQALDANDVVALGSDGNLWLETWPYGDVAETVKTRKQIDGNVGAFEVVQSGYGNRVFVLGTDGNLWSETWPPSGDVAQMIATRQHIDSDVRDFRAMDVNDLTVLGSDGNLWWEGLPFGNVAQTIRNRRQIDGNVVAFQPIDGYNIYVLGTDGKLWLETWPVPGPNTPNYRAWGNVQETINRRKQVDANVAVFQAVDVNTVFVLGSDGNLWHEMAPWGDVTQTTTTRHHVDANVSAFYVWVDAHNTLDDWVVFARDTDRNLWHEQSPVPWESWSRFQIDGGVM